MSPQILIYLNCEEIFYKTACFHICSFPVSPPHHVCCLSYKWKDDFSVTPASSAWVRHKVKPHPLCLLKAAPVMKIWLLQLSQVFCWFWEKNHTITLHLYCPDTTTTLGLSTLTRGKTEELFSQTEGIPLYSKIYDSWNLCLADNLLSPLLGSGCVKVMVVQFWCDI